MSAPLQDIIKEYQQKGAPLKEHVDALGIQLVPMIHPKTGATVMVLADIQTIINNLFKGFVLVLNSGTGYGTKLVFGRDLKPDIFEELANFYCQYRQIEEYLEALSEQRGIYSKD